MKKIAITFVVLCTLAACSTPKYAYYFDHYDYQAGKRKQSAANMPQQEAAIQTEPAMQEPAEEIVLASAGTDLRSVKEARTPVAGHSKKGLPSISREERKKIRKDIREVIKTYKHDIKKSPVKKSSPDAPAGGDKNQLVALLLAIFLGWVGAHRFYLGRILGAVGQLALLVIGLFTIIPLYILAVWVLLDIILIITGDLSPKSGSYNPKL